MKEKVMMNVDKDIANAINVIQSLNECGLISVSNELSCMGSLWEKLKDADKQYILGMIRGSAVALANKTE